MLRLRTKSKRVLLHSWTRHYKNVLGAGRDYNSKKHRDKGIKSTIAFVITIVVISVDKKDVWNIEHSNESYVQLSLADFGIG